MKELMMKMLLLNNMNYMLSRTSDFLRTILILILLNFVRYLMLSIIAL